MLLMQQKTELEAQVGDSDTTTWRRNINGHIYMLSPIIIVRVLVIQTIAHKSITYALHHYTHVCPVSDCAHTHCLWVHIAQYRVHYTKDG